MNAEEQRTPKRGGATAGLIESSARDEQLQAREGQRDSKEMLHDVPELEGPSLAPTNCMIYRERDEYERTIPMHARDG